jgi:hypothetical protein
MLKGKYMKNQYVPAPPCLIAAGYILITSKIAVTSQYKLPLKGNFITGDISSANI